MTMAKTKRTTPTGITYFRPDGSHAPNGYDWDSGRDLTLSFWDKLNHGFYTDENYNLFRADCIAEYGLTNHPKANKAYSLAWEDGHSSGYHEVALCLGKYADLLLND